VSAILPFRRHAECFFIVEFDQNVLGASLWLPA